MVVLFYLFELVLIVSSVIVLLSKDINIMKKSMLSYWKCPSRICTIK